MVVSGQKCRLDCRRGKKLGMEKRGKRDKVQYQRSERDFLSYYLKCKLDACIDFFFFFTTGPSKSSLLMWFVRLLQCWLSGNSEKYSRHEVILSSHDGYALKEDGKHRQNFSLKHPLHPELQWSFKFLTATLTGVLAIPSNTSFLSSRC